MDINELNRLAQAIMDAENSRPAADFEGLSPEQISHMLYNPFEPQCIIQIAEGADGLYVSDISHEKIQEGFK